MNGPEGDGTEQPASLPGLQVESPSLRATRETRCKKLSPKQNSKTAIGQEGITDEAHDATERRSDRVWRKVPPLYVGGQTMPAMCKVNHVLGAVLVSASQQEARDKAAWPSNRARR
jgi:hypothetical protein